MRITRVLLRPLDEDVYRVFWLCKTHDEAYFSEYIPYELSDKCYGLRYIKPIKGPCGSDNYDCTLIRLGPKRFSDEKLVFEYIDDPKEWGSQKHTIETLNYCECIDENGEIVNQGINVK